MVFDRNPSIQSFDFAADFVEYLQRGDAPATMLIVCSTRDAFLQQICASASIAPTEPGDEQPPHSSRDDNESNMHTCSSRRFYNTIGLIAQSNRVTLAFCPSLEHFRAYISSFCRHRLMSLKQDDDDLHYGGGPLLAILGLLALHYDTREFSAQGIGKNLALTVEVAARESVNLTLCECIVVGREYASGGSLWEADVPLLSGQARGTTGGENAHTGRSVKVKQVAQRWFYFM
ncbi:hypothetical protein ACJ72_04908 [Emergomyces africanus]|uniref:Uncharacterized protein n=1 Tax=Emergomyces africanus TaxID=1955775 RepID=A0A1B7NVG4_9EURO|nr:hypothetical protein ACJ72_04908 [Emergomyces africanus]